ncbi:dihydrodipicolinate synthase family protein [Oceanimonas sp. NS1]|uniref:Dihydrodipicolinate synthase family protein n=1 Tax=Oceanimonas doudoroffii TaxID=84158 RepID=A0A233RJV8_9GAMM|nr:dihydrodipicolinate synthase family protein [Oceanimonas doudoroffii]MCT7653987.1 dihydrodipicolinate synthase family protein [Oceanimonas sp. NS1]OXY83669.1 dihydrodipicolinate synthase family protein [Oceanimonas doudoroffii]
MFSGLSAFPLTPMNAKGPDEAAFVCLIERLAEAKVDSIGALGSTGSYAYLNRAERARVARLAVQHAGQVPVMVGIGATSTREVLRLAEDAQLAGASALLLAPVSYQPLTSEEVYELYSSVSHELSVPLCVYDNPRTTHFEFSDELHGRIARLPGVASIKIPGVPAEPEAARERVARLRKLIPSHVSIGISGDPWAATGLNAGCEIWYSVLGGLFPQAALALTRAAQRGDAALAEQLSRQLAPLWAMYNQHGSARVTAAAAELLGYVNAPCLPAPLQALNNTERTTLASLLTKLAL